MTDLEQLSTQMVSGCGFIAAFWTRLIEYRKADIPISQRQVFDELNDFYESRYGQPRFPSYDAFKKFKRRNSANC